MTFEIQGIACARHINGYEYDNNNVIKTPNEFRFNLYHNDTTSAS